MGNKFTSDVQSTKPVKVPGAIVCMSGDEALQLRAVDIDITIANGVAEHTINMTFFNPVNSQVEGELDFPLPEDGTSR